MFRVLEESNGFCVSVGEVEMREVFEWFINVGFFVELIFVVVFVGMWKFVDLGEIFEGFKVFFFFYLVWVLK